LYIYVIFITDKTSKTCWERLKHMQIQKIISKELDKLLQSHKIPFDLQKDKKGNYFLFNILPHNPLVKKINGISIEIYKKYLLLSLFGWKYYEKIESVDSLENLKIIQILDKFLHHEMKIKIAYRKITPIQWKIFMFKKNTWVLYKNFSRFFKKHFLFGTITTQEFSIETLLYSAQGEK